MKRSYTGFSEDHIISTRTSETGWPTWSDLVIKILKRAFSTVGYDDFWLSHTDGIQVLRYNESKAYAPHVDYLHDPDGNQLFDYDSAKKGGNRFATILLYMNELGDQDGGETVFSEAWPQAFSEDAKITIQQATEALRASGDASMLDKGSWEEEMVATCRTRLSVRPTLGRAVLFYSQHPNGKVDEMSRHGGCPVLNGVKWAANVWLWSTPREGFTRAPLKKSLPQTSQQLYATFSNSGNDPVFENAVLYFEDNFWGKLGYGDPPLSVNTYPGHRWNVKVDQETLKTFIIGNDDRQEYVV
jgi:prolyl 4-hydroxylase